MDSFTYREAAHEVQRLELGFSRLWCSLDRANPNIHETRNTRRRWNQWLDALELSCYFKKEETLLTDDAADVAALFGPYELLADRFGPPPATRGNRTASEAVSAIGVPTSSVCSRKRDGMLLAPPVGFGGNGVCGSAVNASRRDSLAPGDVFPTAGKTGDVTAARAVMAASMSVDSVSPGRSLTEVSPSLLPSSRSGSASSS